MNATYLEVIRKIRIINRAMTTMINMT